MSSIIRILFLLSFLCLIPLTGKSQTAPDGKVELIQLLKEWESTFDVVFSFANQDLTNRTTYIPKEITSLQEIIAFLNQEGFLVTVVGDDIYAISLKSEILCLTIKDSYSGAILEEGLLQINDSVELHLSELRNILRKNVSRLTVKTPGYFDKTYSPRESERSCDTVLLTPLITVLDPVILTEVVASGINKLRKGSYEITFKNFSILPGLIDNDALQALSVLPGVLSTDGSVTRLNIRGGSHDQNLVTWNHIKMYQTGHFFNYISGFDPNMISRVRLSTHGSGAEAFDGVSGSIALHSADSLIQKPQFKIGSSLIQADIFAHMPLGKKWNLDLSARRSINDLDPAAKTLTYDKYFDAAFQNSEVVQNQGNVIDFSNYFRFYDTSGRLLFKPSEPEELSFNFIYTKNDLRFSESAFVEGEERSENNSSQQQNLGFGLYHNLRWSPRLRSTVSLSHSNYELQTLDEDLLNQTRKEQKNSVREFSGAISLNAALKEKWSLLVGYDFQKTRIENAGDSLTGSDGVVNRHAVFVESDNTVGDNINLLSGLRITWNPTLNRFFYEPRIRLHYDLTNRLSWNASFEMKHQTTTQISATPEDFLGIDSRRWVLADDVQIPVLQSTQFNSGLDWKNTNWSSSLHLYHKQISGLLSSAQELATAPEDPFAQGNGYSYGLELLLNRKTLRWSYWMIYSLAKHTFTFPDLEENSFNSTYDIRQCLNPGMAYTPGKWKFATSVFWRNGNPFTPLKSEDRENSDTLSYDTLNSERLPSYLRWDASATYSWRLRNALYLKAGFSIWNITNERNTTGKYFFLTENGEIATQERTGLRRTPNLLLRIQF